MMRLLALLLAAVTSAVAAESTVLKSDTPSTTAQGNKFVAPAEWKLERAGDAVILTSPEGSSRIGLVDVEAKDAAAAVAAAWRQFEPDAKWPVKVSNESPPRDGWEERRVFLYEVSANEKRDVYARTLRRGKRWTVVIQDLDSAVAEKRAGQIALVSDKLLPKGYERETFAGRTPRKLDAIRLQALEGFVEDARKQLDVPGVGLGIVQDGKVLFAGGLGVRQLGKKAKVDGDTLFMIASNTKALTTLMLAKLVAQKKFDWSTPVTQLLPSFQLGSPETTKKVQVQHLICACTGLPRQDYEWLFEGDQWKPDDLMHTLATMQPTSDFGALFQYSNPMAAAAGFAAGHVVHPDLELGAAYDQAMQELVFDPLGMKSTTFDYAKALGSADHAMPHGTNVDDHPARASMDVNYTIVASRPAGAAWSSVNDLLRYVQMELGNGTLPDGSRYIAEDALLERRKQKVAIGNNVSYGMGLMTDRTWGVAVVHHGGDMVGFHSDMMWIPDAKVGAVILTNADKGVAIRGLFQRRLLEVLYDGKEEAAPLLAASIKSMKASFLAERKRLTVPADAAIADKLAKHYRNDALGDFTISRKGKALMADAGAWKSELASRRNDDGTVSLITIEPGNEGFEFVVGEADGKRRLVTRDGQHEYVFEEAGGT